jgi:hypothetical protein
MTTLNPPETAPKDGTPFLGHFGYPWLLPTTYSPADEKYCYAKLECDLYKGEWNSFYFTNEWDENLLGWIPMPILPKEVAA